MTQQLSPASQAVLNAFEAKQDEMHEVTWLTRNPDRDCIAAALRAAADQVVPEGGSRRNNEIRSEFLSIAEELDAQ